jgi:transposase IS4-like protein
VFFGVLIYMGCHRETNYKVYWEEGKLDAPIHGVRYHMSINRFENLRRYFHISDPGELEDEEEEYSEEEEGVRDGVEVEGEKGGDEVEQAMRGGDEVEEVRRGRGTDEVEGQEKEGEEVNEAEREGVEVEGEAEINEKWWHKITPLLGTFRTACETYLTPGTNVAIDEIMVRFHGRSGDTCKMPNKPIKQGYKIFALATDAYVWWFQLSSRRYGIAELDKHTKLTNTGSMVLQMARKLPKFDDSYYALYLDNYFTSIPLFSTLRKEKIGAAGTTQPSGLEFPSLLIVLRQNWSHKLDWGTMVGKVVDNVLSIGWQDNNFVFGLSTIHTIHEASSWVKRERRRPNTTSMNATTARAIFGDLPRLEIDILTWVDDYNHHMGSVDLANQLRAAYHTQKIAYRNWIPLFHWVLDQAIINAYKLGVFGKTWHDTHVEFRRELYRGLLSYSNPRIWKKVGLHIWVLRGNRQTCVWCSKLIAFKKEQLKEQEKRGMVYMKEEEILPTKRPPQSWSGCSVCDVALCKTSGCWEKWHSQA